MQCNKFSLIPPFSIIDIIDPSRRKSRIFPPQSEIHKNWHLFSAERRKLKQVNRSGRQEERKSGGKSLADPDPDYPDSL